MHVEYDERHQHLLRIDGINGVQAGMEMGGRIHVRAPLPHMAVLIDPKAILLNRVERLDRLVGCALPMRDARGEGVGEIDEMVGLHDGERVGQRGGVTRVRRAGNTQERGAGRGSTNSSNRRSHGDAP